MSLFCLVLLLAAGGWADEGASVTCVVKSGGKYKEPPTLDALLDCQKNKLVKAALDYKKKTGSQSPDKMLSSWRKKQQEEERDYRKRHAEVTRAPKTAPKTQQDADTPSDKAREPGVEPSVDRPAGIPLPPPPSDLHRQATGPVLIPR